MKKAGVHKGLIETGQNPQWGPNLPPGAAWTARLPAVKEILDHISEELAREYISRMEASIQEDLKEKKK